MSKRPDLLLPRNKKVEIIRRCFREQPMGGWSKSEVAVYLESIKIEPRKTDDLTDAEIDLIFEDLSKSKMI